MDERVPIFLPAGGRSRAQQAPRVVKNKRAENPPRARLVHGAARRASGAAQTAALAWPPSPPAASPASRHSAALAPRSPSTPPPAPPGRGKGDAKCEGWTLRAITAAPRSPSTPPPAPTGGQRGR
eukprot:1182035-Prorocentrum_minimum.AAC.2